MYHSLAVVVQFTTGDRIAMNIFRCLALLCCGFCFFHLTPVQGQRVAEQKCQEYIDHNSQLSYGGTLSLFPDVIEVKATNCSTSVDLIINGVEALEGEFPHQALLGKLKNNSNDLEFYCGGSLISERFVLTAAHCLKPTVVRLGEHNLTDPNGIQVDYNVADYTRHPRFTISKAYFDIALVQLATEVEFVLEIRPACLWTSDPFNYSSVVATGFGATENGLNSTVLMKVRLNVMDKAKCEYKFFGHRKFDGIKDEQLCVGSQEGGKDTCSGDSGGPIQVSTDLDTCAYYVVGITSYGGKCGIGTSESVYTKVASYVDWIEQHVWPDEWIQSQGEETESSLENFVVDRAASEKRATVSPNSYRIYFPGEY